MAEVERLQLDAPDRLDARFLRGVPETHRAVQAVGVGERERVHAALLRGSHEVVDRRRAVEERVVAVNVKFHVSGHTCSPSGRLERPFYHGRRQAGADLLTQNGGAEAPPFIDTDPDRGYPVVSARSTVND